MAQNTPNRTSTAVTAEGRYESYRTQRELYLQRAREASTFTIPGLVPWEGMRNNSYLTPFQSLGARGVNNLASKLLLALMPPGSSFFRLTMDDYVVAKLIEKAGSPEAGEDARGQFEAALGRVERAVINRMEQKAFRTVLFEALKQLIVAGNSLLFVGPDATPRIHYLHQYVVKRDPAGTVLEIVVKECIARETLSEDVKNFIAAMPRTGQDAHESPENTVDVFTWVQLDPSGSHYKVHQEIEGTLIPDTEGTYPREKLPWLALRLTRIDGEDYGRGLVEEYIGDLMSFEYLRKAIVEFSAAASKILYMVNPGGTTDRQKLAEAPNGEFIEGDARDITTLQLEKSQDFQIANETAQSIEASLKEAFLLNSSVQRNAERVTAEEIRTVAGELEQALGGIYSILALELQLPLAVCVMHEMQRARQLPNLPEDTVSPQIVTGVEALGRNSDLTKLDTLISGIGQEFGQEAVAQYLNVGALIRRRATALGVDVDGIVRTDQEVQQAQQQQQQMEMAKQTAGPALQFMNNRMTAGEQMASQQSQGGSSGQ